MAPLTIENLTPIRLSAWCRPILVVGVDTEEEFDWNTPFDRSATGTTAMREVWRFQDVCERFGIKPVYVLDYPVAAQPENLDRFLPAVEAGRAIVGAHLDPWVNPPFEETVDTRNSYLGNLPAALQRAKLISLIERIEATFGSRPTVFKAGRYGLGPATPALLEAHGFEFDMSVCSAFDHSSDGGPDSSDYDADPFLVRATRPDAGNPHDGRLCGLSRPGRGAALPGGEACDRALGQAAPRSRRG